MVLFFYKVTCPVCRLAAPKVQSFELAYPGRIRGIGQDPPVKLAGFGSEFGMTFRSSSDPPGYPLSRAYGIRVVPTVVLVDSGLVAGVVESWDRDGLNELSRRVASLAGLEYAPISEAGDGLPPFRPG